MSSSDTLLAILGQRSLESDPWIASSELAAKASLSWATVKRQLSQLVLAGTVTRKGKGRTTRYRLSVAPLLSVEPETIGSIWSAKSTVLRSELQQSLAMREPVTYRRTFVDDYFPNRNWLLPEAVATELVVLGRMPGQQPAGTYARKVLEPLLIDLSWSSSRLEGNRYSLLATEELFKSGVAGSDKDAVMLLNHKAAIEFLVDTVPEYGLTTAVMRNLHAILMRDLLADADGLGNVRRKVVNISDTSYVPAQAPLVLEEMLGHIVDKARQIKNPIEASFFLWINLAYLQPFEDGNKRTSRLAANIPLLLYNCAPLSFLDIDVKDYALAMLGVYERCDASLATELFSWAYRRSIKKYATTLEAMGVPDPVRLQFREALNAAIGNIVRERQTMEKTIAALSLTPDQAAVFRPLLATELRSLGLHNCGRYRLTLEQVRQWIDAGRPA